MPHVTPTLTEAREWPLVVATARMDLARRATESRAQLTLADNRLLWLLTTEGASTMKEIGDALALEQSTVSRQVNAALERGLVEKQSREGCAARVLAASERGRDLFATEMRRGMGALGEALDVLPADEREQFVEQLLRFTDAYRTTALRVAAETD